MDNALSRSVPTTEAKPLVERLRTFPFFYSLDGGRWYRDNGRSDPTCTEAADCIEALRCACHQASFYLREKLFFGLPLVENDPDALLTLRVIERALAAVLGKPQESIESKSPLLEDCGTDAAEQQRSRTVVDLQQRLEVAERELAEEKEWNDPYIARLERELSTKDTEIAQSVAMYAQVTLGSRELVTKLKEAERQCRELREALRGLVEWRDMTYEQKRAASGGATLIEHEEYSRFESANAAIDAAMGATGGSIGTPSKSTQETDEPVPFIAEDCGTDAKARALSASGESREPKE